MREKRHHQRRSPFALAWVMLCAFSTNAMAAYLPVTVEESDASPSAVNIRKIKVTNGTLTDDGNGTVTIDTSGSAGASQWTTATNDIHFSTGNVVIGTTTVQSPYRLQVSGNSNTVAYSPGVLFDDQRYSPTRKWWTGTTASYYTIRDISNTRDMLVMDGNGRTGLGGPATVDAGGQAGSLNLQNNVSLNGVLAAGGGLKQMILLNAADKVSIAPATDAIFGGNVGIGTTSPGTILDVLGTGGTTLRVSSTNSDTSLQAASASGFDPYLDLLAGAGTRKWTVGNDSSDADKFKVGTGTPGVGTRMTIDTSGNVGIGSTAPTNKLDVVGNLGAWRYSADPGSSGVHIYKSRGTGSTNTIVNNSDQLGQVSFYGANGSTFDITAYMLASVDGTPGATSDMPSRLAFFTTPDGSATPAERLRIDNAGNVGIGTTAPASIGGFAPVLDLSGANPALTLHDTTASAIHFQLGVDADTFYLRDTNGTRLAINDTNVGIGSTDPQYKLDVAGDVNVTGNFKVNGTNISTGSQWTTAGSEIHFGDNVGIGTTNPANRLHIKNSAENTNGLALQSFGTTNNYALVGNDSSANGLAALYTAATPGTPAVYLKASGDSYFTGGNVGVGTASPRTMLDITSGSPNVPGDALGQMLITGPSLDPVSTNNGNLFIQSNSGQAANAGGSVAFGGHYLSGQANGVGFAAIKGAKENGTTSNSSGYLAMFTKDNTAGTREHMRITSAGSVGIGTTTPLAQLSNTNSTGGMSGTNATGIAWKTTANDYAAVLWGAPASGAGYGLRLNTSGQTSSDYPLWISSGATGGTPIMTATGAGTVGIGTISPADRFTVEVATNKRLGVEPVASSVIADYSAGAAAIQFSRPSDGSNNLHGIFSYDTASANSHNLALATRGDLVFAAGGSSGYEAAPEAMRVEAGGNVGIGTANPETRLHVAGSSIANLLKVDSASNMISIGGNPNARYLLAIGGAGDLVWNSGATSTNDTAAVLIRPVSIANTSGTGDISMMTIASATTLNPAGASVWGTGLRIGRPAKGGAGTFDNMATLFLDSSPAGGTNNYALYSAGAAASYFAGNVGLGTTSAGSRLTVDAGSANTIALFNTTGNGGIQMTGDRPYLDLDDKDAALSWRIQHHGGEGAIPGALAVQEVDAGSSPYRMLIESVTGDVGIGTTNPAYKLDVAGDVNVTGNFKVNGVNISGGSSQWTTAGSELYYNVASGYVGIGTTNPQEALHVQTNDQNQGMLLYGSANSNDSDSTPFFISDRAIDGTIRTVSMENQMGRLQLRTGSTGLGGYGTTRMTIDTAGNVGIGTTNPSGNKLWVAASDNSGGVFVQRSDTSGAGSALFLAGSRGSVSSPTDVQDGDTVGRIATNLISGGSWTGNSQISFEIDGTFTSGQRPPGRISFWTNPANTSPAVNMVIKGNGNVGIGTTTPGGLLDVRSTTNNAFPLVVRGDIDNDGGTTGIGFSYEGDGSVYQKARIMVRGTSGYVQPMMHFLIDNTADSSNADINDAKMTILPTGNIGIGSITPGYKLDVAGDINLTGSLRVNGTAQTLGSQWTTAGSELYYNVASGYVGIGTTNPQEALHVQTNDQNQGMLLYGSANSNDSDSTPFFISDRAIDGTIRTVSMENAMGRLQFRTGSTGLGGYGTTRMTIDTAGNVGIGTTAPSSTRSGLDIASGGLSLILGAENDAITRANTTAKVGRVGVYHYTNAEEPMAVLMGVPGATTNVLDIGGGSGLTNAATQIGFWTAANSTTLSGTERMRIDSAGNVGIGTTAPGAGQASSGAMMHLYRNSASAPTTLEISNEIGATNAGNLLQFFNEGGGGDSRLAFTLGGASGYDWAMGIDNSDSDKFKISGGANDNSTDVGSNARLTIDTAGNIGIGTTNPGAGQLNPGAGTKLHLFQDSASNPTTLAIVNEIGTTNAGTLLNFFNEGGGGDARVAFTLGGGSGYDWVMGVDNSDSDKFKISGGANDNSTDVGSNARMTIDTAGNVGIGSITPGYKLDVAGDVNITGAFRVNGTPIGGSPAGWTDGGTTIYNTTLTDFVGIGTTTAAGSLHVAATGDAQSYIGSAGTNAVDAALLFQKSRNTLASPADVANGDALGRLMFRAYSGSFMTTAEIRAVVDGTFTSGQRPPSLLSFYTNAANGATTERMRIDNAGNVGIGATSPGAPLEVKGSSSSPANGIFVTTNTWTLGTAGTIVNIGHGAASGNTYGLINSLTTGGTVYGNLALQTGGGNVAVGTTDFTGNGKLRLSGADSSTSLTLGGVNLSLHNTDATANNINSIVFTQSANPNGWSRLGVINADRTGGSEDQHMFFGTIGGGTFGERMRILSTGNVGIGSTDPQYKLDVAGDVNVTGAFRVNGTPIGGSPAGWTDGGTNVYATTSTDSVAIGTTTPVGKLHILGGPVRDGSWHSGLEIVPSGAASYPSIYFAGQESDRHGAVIWTKSSSGNDINQVRALIGTTNLSATNADMIFMTNNAVGTAAHTEKMRIMGSGNVGIGSTNPGQKLDVAGTTRTTDLNVTGQAGIGTSVPVGKLHIQSTIARDGGWHSAMELSPNGTTNYPSIYFSGQESDRYGGILWTKSTSGSDPNQLRAVIQAGGHTSTNSDIQFMTNNAVGTATVSEKMRILGNGNVGIGSTNPQYKLDVVGNTLITGTANVTGTAALRSSTARDGGWHAAMEIIPTAASNYPSIYFSGQEPDRYSGLLWTKGTSGNDPNQLRAVIQAGGHTSTNSDIQFMTNNAVGTATVSEKMRILGNGNVGIGTTAPGSTLSVRYGTGGVDPANSVMSVLAGDSVTYTTGAVFHVKNVGNRGNVGNVNGSALFKAEFTDSMGMVINKDGNVGIGSATPGYKLDVNGSLNVTSLYINGVPSGGGSQWVNGTGSNIYYTGNVGLGGVSGPATSLDAMGIIRAINTGAALNPASGKGLEIQYVTSGRSQGEGAYLIPYDRTGGAYKALTMDALNMNFAIGGAVRMALDTAGNVGIGTTSPGARLESRIADNAGGSPATSGSAQNGAGFRVSEYSVTMDMGINQNSTFGWIQTANKSNLSVNYPLTLNPNGGSVNIGSVGSLGPAASVVGTGASTSLGISAVGNDSQLYLRGFSGSTAGTLFLSGTQFLPLQDNQITFGNGSARWTYLYAVNGTVQTSDAREKTGIISSPLGLDFIRQLRPVSYQWMKGDGRQHFGMIAQDVDKLVPPDSAFVDKTDPNRLGMNYSEFIAPIIKAVQEEDAKIEELRAKNTELEARLATLEKTLASKVSE